MDELVSRAIVRRAIVSRDLEHVVNPDRHVHVHLHPNPYPSPNPHLHVDLGGRLVVLRVRHVRDQRKLRDARRVDHLALVGVRVGVRVRVRVRVRVGVYVRVRVSGQGQGQG